MPKYELKNVAVERARARRVERANQRAVEMQFFIEEAVSTIRISLRSRVRLATQFIQTQVVRNISRPVTKTPVLSLEKQFKTVGRKVTNTDGGQEITYSIEHSRSKLHQRTRVTNRSKAGEFPKADTTQLLKSIFASYKEGNGVFDGYVGTTLDYGLILETSVRLRRSFLVRTLRRHHYEVHKILSGPIR